MTDAAKIREDERGQKWIEFESGWWMRYYDVPERLVWDGRSWAIPCALSDSQSKTKRG